MVHIYGTVPAYIARRETRDMVQIVVVRTIRVKTHVLVQWVIILVVFTIPVL
jgi:hypothetical protein